MVGWTSDRADRWNIPSKPSTDLAVLVEVVLLEPALLVPVALEGVQDRLGLVLPLLLGDRLARCRGSA
jgi:hypothetical protein